MLKLNLVCVAAAVLFTGCASNKVTNLCEESGLYQAVYNNIKYRDEIRKEFSSCMKGNSNRDVVYNDTNELAKTCRDIAHNMYGGIAASNWTFSSNELAKVELDLRKCRRLKDIESK